MDNVLWIIGGALVSLMALYFIVYWAVLAALREHSVWQLEGGAEKALRIRKENNGEA
ncbi:hypothetical protein [Microbacterium sp.]|uniref:hypothetical protein n=1 Tax=Microbacterium sp. TaxID=51671 RepID=UPI0039E3DA53